MSLSPEEERELQALRARYSRSPNDVSTFGAAGQPQPARNTLADQAHDAVLGIADAATFGFLDEGFGLLLGEQGRRDTAKALDSAQRDNPGAFFLGGLLSMALPGLGIASAGGRAAMLGREVTHGAKMLDKARYAAGASAATGALYGFGSGETLEERLNNAAGFGLTGAAMGGALPPLAAALQRAGGAVGQPLRSAGQAIPGVRALPGVRPTQSRAANPTMAKLRATDDTVLAPVFLKHLPGVNPTVSRTEALLYDRLAMDMEPRVNALAAKAKPGDPPPTVADALQKAYAENRNAGGSPPALLDIGGENTSRFVEYAASLPGPGRNTMRAEVDKRINDQAAQVERMINKRTGAPAQGGESLRTTLMALDAEQRKLAGAKYARIRDIAVEPLRPVQIPGPDGTMSNPETVRLGKLLARPSIQRATVRATQLASEFGIDLQRLGLRPGGVLTRADGRINLELLNWIKMGLDAELSIARSPMSNIEKTERAAMSRTAAQLVHALDALVAVEGRTGEYAAARNVYAGLARMKDAAELGRRIFAPGEGGHSGFLDDAAELLYPRDMNGAPVLQQGELKAALAGLRDGMLEKAFSAQDGRDLYRALLGNKAVRQRIAAIFGPLTKTGQPGPQARAFFKQVLAEAERLRRIRETYSRTGSQTAPRMMEGDAVDEAMSEAFVRTVFDGLTGNWLQALMQNARGLVMGPFAKNPLTPQEAAQVVNLAVAPLSARSGQPLAAAQRYRELAEQMRGRNALRYYARLPAALAVAYGGSQGGYTEGATP